MELIKNIVFILIFFNYFNYIKEFLYIYINLDNRNTLFIFSYIIN
jgi:hypothetical protein